jgi:hypothetical protein
MKLCLKLSPSFCATMRPKVSALPPGAKGAMMRTGFVGHACAHDEEQAKRRTIKPRKRIMARIL